MHRRQNLVEAEQVVFLVELGDGIVIAHSLWHFVFEGRTIGEVDFEDAFLVFLTDVLHLALEHYLRMVDERDLVAYLLDR